MKVAGAILGAMGVIAGAFGAHGLKGRVDAELYETAVFYHLVHAVAIVVAARHRAAAWLFAAGIVIFSGSLYALSAGAPTWLGMVAPIGGTALIAGWIALAVEARREP